MVSAVPDQDVLLLGTRELNYFLSCIKYFDHPNPKNGLVTVEDSFSQAGKMSLCKASTNGAFDRVCFAQKILTITEFQCLTCSRLGLQSHLRIHR